MFDIGFLELVLVGIVALLVLGPERLPHAARMTGAFLGRMTRMVQSLRDEVEREVNIHEMQQRIKKQVEEGMIGDLKKDLAEAQKAIEEGFNVTTQTSPAKTPAPAALPDASASTTADAPTVALPSTDVHTAVTASTPAAQKESS
jgi:sec-independent protein translocase protein TatB